MAGGVSVPHHLSTLAVCIVLVLVVTGPVLVPSTAATFGTDRPHEDLRLAPHDGVNGDYTHVDAGDGPELRLTDANPNVQAEGIAPDAATLLARVFTITNTGERPLPVWITDDSDDVHFFRGDAPANSLESREEAVVLEPSETASVGLEIDTTDPDHDVADAESFSVHASRDDAASDSARTDDSDVDPRRSRPNDGESSSPAADPSTPAVTGERGVPPSAASPSSTSSTPTTSAEPSSTSTGAAGGKDTTVASATTVAGSLGFLAMLLLLATVGRRYSETDGGH